MYHLSRFSDSRIITLWKCDAYSQFLSGGNRGGHSLSRREHSVKRLANLLAMWVKKCYAEEPAQMEYTLLNRLDESQEALLS